jgi:ubiquitin carboxyl-terminal hydrolase 5/13
MPSRTHIPLPCPVLPQLILDTITAIQSHESAYHQEEVAAWQEERFVSKYAYSLQQLPVPEGKVISMNPADWKCDETGVTDNLWLNLSTGFIGSGRQNFDGTGGNGAAMRHFEATGKKYPLVVKLGTITPSGADVYSYADDENDMVIDPLLETHLSHWGINMKSMEKTEKTMAELQIEVNLKFEFDRITEAGAQLKPLHGPGFIGLKNLGNSCYMNSVLQLLWTVAEMKERYVDRAEYIYETSPVRDTTSDMATQLAKVGVALILGKTCGIASDDGDGTEWYVKPAAFKAAAARGHPEFSSTRQQDAQEYLGHLLDRIARNERSAGDRLGISSSGTGGDNSHQQHQTADLFRFAVEHRTHCGESDRVSYTKETTTQLGLNIPLEEAANKEQVEEHKEREMKRARTKEGGGGGGEKEKDDADEEERVIPKVPFEACLKHWAADANIDEYHSAALGRKTGTASRRSRFASFPPYLFIVLQRYMFDPVGNAMKLEVEVEVPDQLSLEQLRSCGQQPNEELQPADDDSNNNNQQQEGGGPPVPDQAIVESLVSMGFSENGSKRAALATGNAGAEVAAEWVFAHMEDPDFNDPPPPSSCGGGGDGGGGGGSSGADDAEAVMMLTGMGFTGRQATAALKACKSNVERAADWLFSRADGDLDASVEAALSQQDTANGNATDGGGGGGVLDGPGNYDLVGFISHMGANTACGHYVAHVKKRGKWVVYNDEKVAESANPPKELGYIYMFKRRSG